MPNPRVETTRKKTRASHASVELNRCAVGKNVVHESQADAASLAKACRYRTGTVVLTYHETLDRPGSSGRNRDLVLAARARLGRQPVYRQGGNVIRIISARKADPSERRHYNRRWKR